VSGLISVSKGHGGEIEASYAGYSPNLKTLIQNTDLLIVGEVVNQVNYGEVSVITEVQITRIVKGSHLEKTVKVIQLKDGYELVVGDKYLLALLSCKPEYDSFYEISAGIQGVFRQKEKGIEVFMDTFIPELEGYIKKHNKINITIDDLSDWFETF